MFKNIFYFLIINLIFVNAYSATITGNYKCLIHDFDENSRYEKKLTIAKTGQTYRLQYYPIDSSIVDMLGTGVLEDNIFAAINWKPSSKWIGPSHFVVKENGSLVGTWTSLHSHLVGTQICNKI